MEAKVNYILVGIFVLFLGTVLIAGVLWFSAGAGPRKEYDRYLVYPTESVSGLSVDAAVHYRGVPVGRVAEMSLDPEDPERVRVLLEIQQGTPIKEDTVATLEFQALTGVANINLTGGTRTAAPLRARGDKPYPVIKSAPSLWGRLEIVMSELSRNIKGTADRLNDVLSDNNRRALEQTLAHMEQLTGTLAARSPKLATAVDDLAGTLHNAGEVSARLPAVMQQVQQSVTALNRMADEMSKAGDTLNQVMVTSGKDVERFTSETLPQMGALVVELRETAESLRRVLGELERDPGALLFGAPRSPPGPGE